MHHYPELPPKAFAAALRRRLLAWFRRAGRDLPWRADPRPYPIWISEVMLQQTQVATVVPYFRRFLAAFPTVAALAAAPEQEVLRLWEGLGYYRRARALHRAAQEMVARFGGEVPRAAADLGTLPGVGRYTCNAVLSQAYDVRLPIVEANSARVLCRWFACREDLQSGAVQKWLWDAAAALLPARNVGAFNQALMELGALICTPTKPACLLCPVKDFCAARAAGVAEALPVKRPPRAPTAVAEAAVVVHRGQEVLLVRRPADAERWANLWEFPHGPLLEGEAPAEGARRLSAALTGLETALEGELATIRHGVTRFQITMTAFRARFVRGDFRSDFYAEGVWVRPGELERYPLSRPQRQLAGALGGPPA